ncbi:hypothetical protein VTI74DRAFT_7124 [Chaetomium olivicolor]
MESAAPKRSGDKQRQVDREVAAAQQSADQHPTGHSADSSDDLASSQTEPIRQSAVIADSDDEDAQMEDAVTQVADEEDSNMSGDDSFAPSVEEQQAVPVNYGAPSQEVLDTLASDPVVMAQSPTVRRRDPYLAASVNQLITRHTNKVRFFDEVLSPTTGGPSFQIPVDEDLGEDDDIDLLEEAPLPSRRKDGRRARRKDEDVDWKPRKSGTRKPGARKRTIDSAADSAPKRRRISAAAQGSRSGARPPVGPDAPKRRPGRPRKNPLPNPTPASTVSPQSSIVAASLSSLPTVKTGPQPTINTNPGAGGTTLPSSSILEPSPAPRPIVVTTKGPFKLPTAVPAVPRANRGAKRMTRPRSSNLNTAAAQYPTVPASQSLFSTSTATPTTDPSAKRTPLPGSAPQCLTLPQNLTASGNNNPFGAPITTSPAVPALNPAARQATFPGSSVTSSDTSTGSSTTTQVAPSTNKKHRAKQRRAAKDSDAESEAGKTRRRPRVTRSTVDVNARMRSSTGEEITHGEFLTRYPVDERRYVPGGREGGGRWEIIATGVMWSFVSAGQRHSLNRRMAEQQGRQMRESQEAQVREFHSATTAEASSQAAEEPQRTHEPLPLENPLQTLAAAAAAAHSTASTTLARPTTTTEQNVSPNIIRIRVSRRQTEASAPTSLYAPTFDPAATAPINPPATGLAYPPAQSRPLQTSASTSGGLSAQDGSAPGQRDPVTAQRIAEIEERCRRLNVGRKRTNFESDQAFFEWAEFNRPLLYPETAPRPDMSVLRCLMRRPRPEPKEYSYENPPRPREDGF